MRTAVDLDDPSSAALLLDPEIIEDPYAFYALLREQEPVWRVPGTPIVVVTSYDAVCEVVARTEDFSSNLSALIYRHDDGSPGIEPFGGEWTNVLATADPPMHTLHRATVVPQLMNKRMAALRPEIDELVVEHLRTMLEQRAVEFMGAVANSVPIRVVSRLVGWQDEDPEELFRSAVDSSAVLGGTRSLSDANAAMVRTAEVGAWITERLDDAIASGADGLLGTLADAVRGQELDRSAALVVLHTLLSAGGESTTSLMGNAVHRVASDPPLQDRLRDEPALITPFTEEMLRLESPFRYHFRSVRQATELNGTEVPAGAVVLLMWGAANRDPAEYDRPDDIVLDRPVARHHLGFGRGIHHCVGAPLARIEATVLLQRLLELTDHVGLDPEHPAVREQSLMVRRFTELPLLVEPASTCPSAGRAGQSCFLAIARPRSVLFILEVPLTPSFFARFTSSSLVWPLTSTPPAVRPFPRRAAAPPFAARSSDGPLCCLGSQWSPTFSNECFSADSAVRCARSPFPYSFSADSRAFS